MFDNLDEYSLEIFCSVLVVILPVILVLVLCLIAALLYRYRRRRGRNYSSTGKVIYSFSNGRKKNFILFSVTIDEYHPAIATIFPISQRNVFVREDLPPPYELISERKATVSSIEANHQWILLTLFRFF